MTRRPVIARRFFLASFAVVAFSLSLSGFLGYLQMRELAREQARDWPVPPW